MLHAPIDRGWYPAEGAVRDRIREPEPVAEVPLKAMSRTPPGVGDEIDHHCPGQRGQQDPRRRDARTTYQHPKR
jgi:hypothetical protein